MDRAELAALVDRLAAARFDEALVLTSFHQSALPTALLLRLAGIGRITAVSTDYPGALLDVRIAEPPDEPEPRRMLRIAEAAGFALPATDRGELRVRPELPAIPADLPGDYLVVHTGSAAPARTCSPGHWAGIVAGLAAAGWPVVLTAPEELPGPRPAGVFDLGGRLRLSELAAVLRDARAVVVGNTGPAHLAAAVGTPVVSLFAPVVPAVRWAPLAERVRVLGDQGAACRGSRARTCPMPGHPCLDSVTGTEVLSALSELGVDRPAMEAIA